MYEPQSRTLLVLALITSTLFNISVILLFLNFKVAKSSLAFVKLAFSLKSPSLTASFLLSVASFIPRRISCSSAKYASYITFVILTFDK